jgi:hypothetical protein
LTLFGVIQGLAEPAEQAEVWPKSMETRGYDDDDDDKYFNDDDDDDKYFNDDDDDKYFNDDDDDDKYFNDDDDDDKYFPQTFQTLGYVGAGDIFLVWLGVSARSVPGGIIVHHEIWYTSPKLWEY